MKERPIVFSGPEVRALLGGRKTQARRVVKSCAQFRRMDSEPRDARRVVVADDQSEATFLVAGDQGYTDGVPCPYGAPGSKLWVRETWGPSFAQHVPDDRARTMGGSWGCPAHPEWTPCAVYRADGDMPMAPDGYETARWCPSIQMPRWASRITLEVSGVRVQRLQDISEEDARAEGVIPVLERYPAMGRNQRMTTGELMAAAPHRAAFAMLWDEINGDRASWLDNPWTWVVEFKRVAQEGAKAA